MSENEKNVPRRRFREFQNAKGWEQRKLDKEVEFYSGLTYSPKDVSDKGTLVLRSSNVKNGEIVDADNVYVNPEVVNSCNVKEGDIIVVVRNGSRSLIGKHAQVKKTMDNTVIGAFMTGVRSNQSGFINALMDTQQFNKEIEKNLGATINQITNRMFCEMTFMFPCKDEQIKIGLFFRKVDDLITLHQRKLEKMKALKKAYLTEMFPAEGERKPKRRFDAFGDDWEQRKVKDICSISTGKSNTQDKIEDGEYPFYVRSPIIERSNRYLYDEEAVLTVGDGVGTGKVFHYVNGKYDLHQRVYRMFDFCNGVSVKYFYYYFSKYFYDRVMAMTAKTSVDSVRYEMIAEMDIKYPSEQEQNQIVITLEQLDNLITIHQYKLEKLQNIKKAYLNEMFI
ncbi:restriction endonuclease subunit S [Clostridium tetani]|uniref:restriction endonuclease subunit S n=1 Tax=Clostridium tetani TaxID=1513 RepID=UPI00100B9881|nr:restriction endonuclease subunit S [Clostridium tetani]RXI44638.1 restriction endonuclease subunit S [Clostridium tetani]RXM59953.1 restriction endonuclease subunit S [Clostridium tetani]RXM66099.1 restriction endonuclease subunit S [Clostridium tetani]